jgi:hypothetical protein
LGGRGENSAVRGKIFADSWFIAVLWAKNQRIVDRADGFAGRPTKKPTGSWTQPTLADAMELVTINADAQHDLVAALSKDDRSGCGDGKIRSGSPATGVRGVRPST